MPPQNAGTSLLPLPHLSSPLGLGPPGPLDWPQGLGSGEGVVIGPPILWAQVLAGREVDHPFIYLWPS